jgi:hypothetical protein
VPSAWRYSAGYQETTLFLSRSHEGAPEVLAVGDRAYGLALDPGHLVVGAEHRFAILGPAAERPTVQEIHYTSGHPQPSWLRRREVQ